MMLLLSLWSSWTWITVILSPHLTWPTGSVDLALSLIISPLGFQDIMLFLPPSVAFSHSRLHWSSIISSRLGSVFGLIFCEHSLSQWFHSVPKLMSSKIILSSPDLSPQLQSLLNSSHMQLSPWHLHWDSWQLSPHAYSRTPDSFLPLHFIIVAFQAKNF